MVELSRHNDQAKQSHQPLEAVIKLNHPTMDAGLLSGNPPLHPAAKPLLAVFSFLERNAETEYKSNRCITFSRLFFSSPCYEPTLWLMLDLARVSFEFQCCSGRIDRRVNVQPPGRILNVS